MRPTQVYTHTQPKGSQSAQDLGEARPRQPKEGPHKIEFSVFARDLRKMGLGRMLV